MSAAWPIQAAAVERWKATPAVVARTPGGIHDGEAPPDTSADYVVVGNKTAAPFEVLGYGDTVTLTVHSFSHSPTSSDAETLAIAHELTVAVRTPLVVPGYGVVDLEWEFEETQEEDDGWRHTITRYRGTALETG